MLGNYIIPSRTSILETLPKVVSSPPKIKSKSTNSSIENVFFELRKASNRHPYLSLGVFVAVLVSLALWGRGKIRRGKGPSGLTSGSNQRAGFFRLDGKESLLGTAGLGGGQNGKVD